MKKQSNNSTKKRKWVNREISKRLKGKSLSKSERSKVFKQVWEEANKKFD